MGASPHAYWQPGPHIVPKHQFKTLFQMTIDLRLVISATIKKGWPMTNLDIEVQFFAGSTSFQTLNVFSEYWKFPSHHNSLGTCGVICLQGTFLATRVLQRLKKAIFHFQSTI